jgi:glycosyltransferase involved in cell wall biosynthesis
MSPKPLVSVIIPTFNESAVIEKNLQAIKNQTYGNIEIIIIDDHSTDSTPNIAKQFTHKVYIRPHAERSIQRNFGASVAKGKYLLFLDADMELTPQVISQCVSAIEQDSKVGATIIPEVSVGNTYWEKVQAFERSFYFSGSPNLEAARFFPSKLFHKLGGYDETISGREDWDLSESVSKLGLKISRTKAFLYHHERITSLLKQMKKDYYYGLTSHRYVKKQRLSLIGPKSIHFLRPELYRDPKKLLSHPDLTLGMYIFFAIQIVSGGAGYIVGRLQRR